MKRKERVKVRNDHLNELDSEFEQVEARVKLLQFDVADVKVVHHGFSVKKLIMSPIGVITLWVLFGVFCIAAKSVLGYVSEVT